MGWFGRKKAEDAVDDELKTYFNEQTSNDSKNSPQVVRPREPEAMTLESVSQAIPEAKLQSREKNLKQVAMDNCVEYEKAYSDCLIRGSLWERFTSCPTQKTMHDKCVELQAMALEVLKFDQAQSDDEKISIKAKADDLMIQYIPQLTITESQVEAFKGALSQPAASSSRP